MYLEVHMVAQIQIPKKRLAELERYRDSKFSASEFRRFLCLWLRAEREMPATEIARVVGFHEATVRIVQRDFIGRGVDAILGDGRGGRRRQLMSPREEAEFLGGFLKAAIDASLLTAARIKSALEERLGKEVHQSTVYRMLERNGWRKVVPRPQHPEQSKEAAGAFKKGASQKRWRRPGRRPRRGKCG
jgi:transposase